MEQELENVYWMGGAGCSGKSTVAELLAAQFDLELYSGDSWLHRLDRSDPQIHPFLTRINRFRKGEIELEKHPFLWPPPEQMQSLIQGWTEYFPFYVEDLQRYPAGTQVIIEGAQMLPEFLEGLVDPKRAIYLNATESFIREWSLSRSAEQAHLRRVADPDTAAENRIQVTILIGQYISRSARDRGFRVVSVDGSKTPQEVAGIVAEHFGLVAATKHKMSPR